MQKIAPFLWFDGKAEEAINSYTSIFKNSKIIRKREESCTPCCKWIKSTSQGQSVHTTRVVDLLIIIAF